MNLNVKYDVFVSYSRKDYVDESQKPIDGSAVMALLDFLDKNGITYWFDKDGIYSGSEFVEVITDAITDSKMMIFVSSEHSNASPWTTGEIFEALEQEKLIVPFRIDNSPYNKKYRMMVRPLDFIEYFTNPAVAFDSLLKAINVCKEEYEQAVAEEAKRKAEEEAKQHRDRIIEEIEIESHDFQRHASNLSHDAQKIVEKQKLIGNKEKKCPVCSTMQPIENVFCRKCGWTFNPVFDAHPKGDMDHLFVMRSLWNAVHNSDATRTNLESKIASLEKTLSDSEAKLSKVQKELKVYTDAEAKRQAEEEAKHQAEEASKKAEAEARAKAEAEAKRKEEEEKKRGIFKVGNIEFRMIHVEGGTFTMGEGSDAHQVTLSPYYIGETLVTQALWVSVMGSSPSRFKGDQNPVKDVSWYDCQDFIKKLNAKTGKKFRLLTEAEWEFAARGGNKSKGYKYAGSNEIDEVAWYDGNSNHETHPVKTKNPNELGIYDMCGNVWEWCQDWYGSYNKSSQTNPSGPSSGIGRVIRGGSWRNVARYCRSSYRNYYAHDCCFDGLGLRLALS